MSTTLYQSEQTRARKAKNYPRPSNLRLKKTFFNFFSNFFEFKFDK